MKKSSGFFGDEHNIKGIIVLVFFIIGSIFLTSLFDRRLGIGMEKTTMVWVGAVLGIVTYSMIIIKFFWKIVPANTGIILQNRLMTTPDPVNEGQITNMITPPVGQRSIMAGPHFTWGPLEKQVGEPIPMTAVEVSGKFEFVDCNDQICFADIKFPMYPIPGKYLPNYAKNTQEFAEEYLKSVMQAQIEKACRYLRIDQILYHRQAFYDDFIKTLLGGEGILSDEEKRMGRFAGPIVLKDIGRGQSAQKAVETLTEMAKTIETAKQAQKDLPGLDAKTALLAVLTYQNKDVKLFGGLEGMANTKAFIAEAIEGDIQGNNGGKKNRRKSR